MSSLLPLEVIELVIDFCATDLKALRHFCLTCHKLFPRARMCLFASITLTEANDLFQTYQHLNAYPQLRPLIHSITVALSSSQPTLFLLESVPVHLLTLPSLRGWRIMGSRRLTTDADWRGAPVLYHAQTLASYERLGTHIRSLHLWSLLFHSRTAFAQLVSAFPNVKFLNCDNVLVSEKTSSSTIPRKIIEERWKLEAKLTTLPVSVYITTCPHT